MFGSSYGVIKQLMKLKNNDLLNEVTCSQVLIHANLLENVARKLGTIRYIACIKVSTRMSVFCSLTLIYWLFDILTFCFIFLIGVLIVESTECSLEHQNILQRSGVNNLNVTSCTDEQALFTDIVSLLQQYDPDILVGYEIQMLSWGYLLQRAAHLNVNLCPQLSRTPGKELCNLAILCQSCL